MGSSTVTTFHSDLSGKTLKGTDHQVRHITYNGMNFDLDLSEFEAKQLDGMFIRSLSRYIAAASVPVKGDYSIQKQAKHLRYLSRVRVWAKKQNIKIEGDVIPQHICEAYDAYYADDEQ